MSTTTVKKKKRIYRHTPNYITLLPPGNILEEKLSEMELSVEGLSECSGLSVEIIQSVLNVEIAVTQEIAEKLEKATRIPIGNWLRYEEGYRKNLEYSKQHPEIPAY
jgi:plasmid maintenance system antidote protein VapI